MPEAVSPPPPPVEANIQVVFGAVEAPPSPDSGPSFIPITVTAQPPSSNNWAPLTYPPTVTAIIARGGSRAQGVAMEEIYNTLSLQATAHVEYRSGDRMIVTIVGNTQSGPQVFGSKTFVMP